MMLGSLFDGSGGFPLAGALHGIKPVWASEIEAYPIRVTKARFPNMEHLGSVLDVKGNRIAPVDIITFGSPCQDLSVAGKQKGIHEGERSSLFFEAVRIAKEMREHDRATALRSHAQWTCSGESKRNCKRILRGQSKRDKIVSWNSGRRETASPFSCQSGARRSFFDTPLCGDYLARDSPPVGGDWGMDVAKEACNGNRNAEGVGTDTIRQECQKA